MATSNGIMNRAIILGTTKEKIRVKFIFAPREAL